LNTLDYFFENYVKPVLQGILEAAVELSAYFLEIALIVFFIATLPLWIIPYAIWKRKRR
jgi:hypothetical protein